MKDPNDTAQRATELLRGKSTSERLDILDRAEAALDEKIAKMKRSGSAPDGDGQRRMLDEEIIKLLTAE